MRLLKIQLIYFKLFLPDNPGEKRTLMQKGTHLKQTNKHICKYMHLECEQNILGIKCRKCVENSDISLIHKKKYLKN